MEEQKINKTTWLAVLAAGITFLIVLHTAQYNAPTNMIYLASTAQDPDAVYEEYLQKEEKAENRFLTITMVSGFALLLLFLLKIYADAQNEKRQEQQKNEIKERLKHTPRTTITHPIHLKPEQLSYVMQNSTWTIMLSLLVLCTAYSLKTYEMQTIAFTILSIGSFIKTFLRHRATTYHINEHGIHIVGGIFKKHATTIDFQTIKDIHYKQAFYEKAHNLGTIFIDTGETDDDGNICYTRLIGITNHKEVAMLITDKARS